MSERERLIALAKAEGFWDGSATTETGKTIYYATANDIEAFAAALSPQGAAPDAQLLFDFGGFLTSSERQWVFSSHDDAAPMVDAIRAFAAKRGIDLDAPHAPAPVQEPDTRVCHRDDRCLSCPRFHGKAEHCSAAPAPVPPLQGAEAIESAAAACEEYASEMKGKQAEGAMECARRLRGNIPRLKAWAFQDRRAAPLQAVGGQSPTVEQAITALVSALADSKGWMRDYADAIVRDAIDRRGGEGEKKKPLSEEEIRNINENLWKDMSIDISGDDAWTFARAIEAAHGIAAPSSQAAKGKTPDVVYVHGRGWIPVATPRGQEVAISIIRAVADLLPQNDDRAIALNSVIELLAAPKYGRGP